MDSHWKKYAPSVCAELGVFLLALTAVMCMRLERGEWLEHAAVAAVLLALAGVSVLLLRIEGIKRDALLVMLLPIGAAFLIRALCLDYAGTDYNNFLSRWYLYFKGNGGFAAVAHAVGDYNVPYLYFMAFISYLSTPDLYLIKLFSIAFDVALAWGCLRLVRCLRERDTTDPVPLIAFGLALLLPTVVLNGSCWGQCDSVWGALCVLALAFALEDKPWPSLALLGLAFAFKLQAIFIVPLWLPLWLRGRVKFRHLLAFPAAFGVSILPALLVGKPLGDILGVYLGHFKRSIFGFHQPFEPKTTSRTHNRPCV